MNRSTRTLRALLAVAIAESLVHYTDNTLRYDDYTVPDPSVLGSLVKQWVIPVAWVLYTIAAVVGYRHFRNGERAKAAAWIGAYSTSGLISVLHYTDISIDDLSVFQNTFVFLDVLLGLALLGFAVSTAWTTPQPVRHDGGHTTRDARR
jgi:peptidoglycan/LPS O-acetylase OafA/YrhL